MASCPVDEGAKVSEHPVHLIENHPSIKMIMKQLSNKQLWKMWTMVTDIGSVAYQDTKEESMLGN